MERNSIGEFLSILRKAQGWTQQEVADKLNVSNKTVSKWERGESSPDLSLIPVFAELYGVTCDEILLGERRSANLPPKAEKTEQQRRYLVGSTIMRFKNAAMISILLTVLGLIFLFSIAYAFFVPVLAFGVCMVFIAVGIIWSIIKFNMANYSLSKGWELDEPDAFVNSSRVDIYRSLFIVIAANVFAFFLSLPFLLVRNSVYPRSVITFGSYLAGLPLVVAASSFVVILSYVLLRNKVSLPSAEKWLLYRVEGGWKMSLIQGGFMVAALLITVPILVTNEELLPSYLMIGIFFTLVLCSLLTVVLSVVRIREKGRRCLLVAVGLRNAFLGLSLLLAYSGIVRGSNYVLYDQAYAFRAMLTMVGTLVLYLGIKYAIVNDLKKGSC